MQTLEVHTESNQKGLVKSLVTTAKVRIIAVTKYLLIWVRPEVEVVLMCVATLFSTEDTYMHGSRSLTLLFIQLPLSCTPSTFPTIPLKAM